MSGNPRKRATIRHSPSEPSLAQLLAFASGAAEAGVAVEAEAVLSFVRSLPMPYQIFFAPPMPGEMLQTPRHGHRPLHPDKKSFSETAAILSATGGTRSSLNVFYPMPRFYLHVCDGTGFVPDDEGQDFPDAEAARKAALDGLRDVLAEDLRGGALYTASFVEIEDQDHQWVATISFEDAVRMSSERPADARR